MNRMLRHPSIVAAGALLATSTPSAFSAEVKAPVVVTMRTLMQAMPAIEYPYEARTRHITGRGVFGIWISPQTGVTTNVKVLQSTGSKILDDAAVKGLSRWRAKPGKVSYMKVPVTSTM
jgi:TonB family protein